MSVKVVINQNKSQRSLGARGCNVSSNLQIVSCLARALHWNPPLLERSCKFCFWCWWSLPLFTSKDWFAQQCHARQTEILFNSFHLWYELGFVSSAPVLSRRYCIHLPFHLAHHRLHISYCNGCPYAYLEIAPAFSRVTALPREIPDL